MKGKLAIAKCGCQGEVIIGQFVRCGRNCAKWRGAPSDGVPVHVDPEKTKKLCSKCGSADLAAAYLNVLHGGVVYRCNSCGLYT